MRLSKLLSGISDPSLVRSLTSPKQVDITSLAYDSRQVVKGDLFFAIAGLAVDGNRYVPDALQRGALAVASEEACPAEVNVPWIRVSHIRRFMACCANHFFGDSSKKLRLVGITGTNGKTTTAHITHNILSQAAEALLVGTINTRIGNRETRSRLTTPEAVDIQAILSDGLARACQFGVLETSSHALYFDRVYGCHFPIAVFTNLSQDHLDFHEGLEDYFQNKRRLFCRSHNPGLEWTLVNRDDPFGNRIASSAESKVASFGLTAGADVHPINCSSTAAGIEAEIQLFDSRISLRSPLVGTHNLYNVLAAAAACRLLKVAEETIRQGISSLRLVPGRFEKVPLEAPFTVIIDFAHTPDALSNVLELAKEVAESKVICVFGCGGDRDKAKRPIMGQLAANGADAVIITSDNPRTEDPESIIHEIVDGIETNKSRCEIVVDRREAIRMALDSADRGDLVLLAGKGHETYQDIGGTKVSFDERQIVTEEFCSI